MCGIVIILTSFGRLNRCPGWSGDQEDLSLTGTSPGKWGPKAVFGSVFFIPAITASLPLPLFPLVCTWVGFLSAHLLHFLVHLHKAYPPPLSMSAHLKSCGAGARSTDAVFTAVTEGRDRVLGRPFIKGHIFLRREDVGTLRKRLQKQSMHLDAHWVLCSP